MCVCVGGGGTVCVLGGGGRGCVLGGRMCVLGGGRGCVLGVCVGCVCMLCVCGGVGWGGSRAANMEGGEWAGWYSNLSHLSEATSAFVGQTATFQIHTLTYWRNRVLGMDCPGNGQKSTVSRDGFLQDSFSLCLEQAFKRSRRERTKRSLMLLVVRTASIFK